MFYLNSRVSYDDLSDGPAFTIFVGEFMAGGPFLGWAVGTMSSLRNTGHPINFEDPAIGLSIMRSPGRTPAMNTLPTDIAGYAALVKDGEIPASYVGGFSSRHPGGANFLFGDGSVRIISQKIRTSVYRSLGNRADGNLISDDDF